MTIKKCFLSIFPFRFVSNSQNKPFITAARQQFKIKQFFLVDENKKLFKTPFCVWIWRMKCVACWANNSGGREFWIAINLKQFWQYSRICDFSFHFYCSCVLFRFCASSSSAICNKIGPITNDLSGTTQFLYVMRFRFCDGNSLLSTFLLLFYFY